MVQRVARPQVVNGSGSEVEEEEWVEEALSSGALSPADACYRRVSRAGRVLRALARAPPPPPPRARALHHAATIHIITVSPSLPLTTSRARFA